MILSMAGGGVPLNFKIVAYKTEEVLMDAKPAENTIGIVTNEITGYIFSATEPANPVGGLVWIKVGTASTGEFNALKKNGIQVYPTSAQQYVSGAWVNKTAKTYQNGAWVAWSLTVVPNVDEYSSAAWTKSGATITAATENTKFVVTSVINGVSYAFVKENTSAFSKLTIKGSVSDASSSDGNISVHVGLFSGTPTVEDNMFMTGYEKTGVKNGNSFSIDNSYDLSAISGECLIGVLVKQGAATKTHTTTFEMTEIELS